MKALRYPDFWLNVPEKTGEHFSTTGNPPVKIKRLVANLEKQGAVINSTIVINSLRREFDIIPSEIVTK